MSFVRKVLKLGRSEFGSAASKLVGATALAQLVSLLALPLLTRLYSPADFGVLGVYSAALTILISVACLRLEAAIPLPKEDTDGFDLLVLALLFSAVVGTVAAIPTTLWSNEIASALGAPEFAAYAWLMPVGAWLGGSYLALQFWASRRKRFGAVAGSRITQSVIGVGAQVGLGFAGYAPFGLLFGNMLSGGAGAIGLAYQVATKDRKLFAGVSIKTLRARLVQYEKFPRFTTWEALANSAGTQMPLVVIALTSSAQEAGFVLLAVRVFAAPLQLVGASVSQVYLSHAPELLRTARLRPFVRKLLIGLAAIGVPSILAISLLAPVLFGQLFGIEWARAGDLVRWMSLWFMLQFLTFPISSTLHIVGRNEVALVLQIFGLLLRVGSVGLAAVFLGGFQAETYAVASAVFYAVYLAVLFWAIRTHADGSGAQALHGDSMGDRGPTAESSGES